MESSQNIHPEVKLKNQKRKTLPDIISKSIFNPLNISIMSTIKNHVQLIGHIGEDPKVTNLESGRKVARFRLATNEHYKDAKGEKRTDTNWHSIVAWGKTAEIIEKYTAKGKEIGVTGKLKTRTYTTDDGNQRYVTEVEANEILLLGGKNDNSTDE